jgi:cyanophycinase
MNPRPRIPTRRCTALSIGIVVSWTAAFCEAQSVGPSRGTLVIAGGGGSGKDNVISRRFVELAGGASARIVVIPTAMEGDEIRSGTGGTGPLREAGAKDVTILHTRDRDLADSEEFLAPLRSATGVWIGGGRQWRLADAYLGTNTQRAIEQVLARGGVIGGGSAGATIQGSYLVRGAPEGNTILMSPGHETGFALLKNVAIDQHVIARGRIADMQQVVDAHPELLGLGIDEQTAIVVQGDVFEVIGDSRVVVTDPRHVPAEGGERWYFLDPGDRFDLKARRKLPAGLTMGDGDGL